VGELACGLDDERAIHEKERLGRDDGFVAAAAGHVGIGEVELREEFGRLAAINVGVDGAAGCEFLGAHRDGFAAEFRLKRSGDGEEGVVELLEIETAEIGAPEVLVVGVCAAYLGLSAELCW